ncbi:MAG TPA: cupin domain-containing protein [Thermoanaerobaculia bacterium]|nr:cupin domain-containing protein [Thermoanaerobaculia bacterium]
MHPPEETLLSVAAGEADVAHRALVEAHAASCAACREELAALSAPGGLLLRAVGETPPPAALWERLVARLPAPAAAAPSPLAGTPVPPAARAELPELDALAWRWPLVRGARIATLWADRAAGTTLLIGHMPGGRPFPRHRHPGGEDVVVLSGAYQDDHGRWESGAYGVYASGSEHRPLTEPPHECWILTRLPRPVEFTGWRGLAQKALGGA